MGDKPAHHPGQNIPIATVPNLRDMGGWPAPGGRVRSGVLFRSAEFGNLQGDDAAAFARLGIRSVYDLRTADERAANPNTLPPGTEYIVLDILADASDAGPAQLAPAQLAQELSDAKTAMETFGDGKAVAMFEEAYRQIVSLPSALTGYRQFFTDISEPEHRPAVFHCTTGKDRTGWAAASFLLLLGVAEDDVRTDYLLTNAQLLPALKPVIDKVVAKDVDPDLVKPIVGVQQEYLDAALDEMRKRYKTIDGYFADGLGLDAATIDRLRDAYIERV
jgi:protein-tyrosine phosphatase